MKTIIGVGNALTDKLFMVKNDDVLKNVKIEKGSMQLVDDTTSQVIQNLLSSVKPVMETGGSASNTISAIAKLGLQTGFIGKVGNDNIGNFFIKDSEKNSVKPYIVRSENPSGNCTVIVSPDSERTMCTFLGSASELMPCDIQREVIAKYDFLHVEGYLVFNKELILEILKIAKEEGLETSIDLASFNVVEDNRDFLLDLIEKYIDIVFANNEEAMALTGKEYPYSAGEIAKMCKIAVVKNGKYGSTVCTKSEKHTINAVKATSVDTTGAGDSYAGGFLYGYLMGDTLDVCGNIGSLVAGKVVEYIGGKIPNQEWDSLLQKVEKLRKKE